MSLFRRLLRTLVLLGLALSPGVVLSADADAQRDLLRRLMRIQEVGLTEPIVTYCRTNAPESAKALDAGYENYVALMETARESLDTEAQ